MGALRLRDDDHSPRSGLRLRRGLIIPPAIDPGRPRCTRFRSRPYFLLCWPGPSATRQLVQSLFVAQSRHL
jgi:hypothetical protein